MGLASLLVVTAVKGTAATILDVSLNTSSLIGNSAGPFAINFAIKFQLTNGDGISNNIVTIGPFSFGGGAPGGNPGSFGNVTRQIAYWPNWSPNSMPDPCLHACCDIQGKRGEIAAWPWLRCL